MVNQGFKSVRQESMHHYGQIIRPKSKSDGQSDIFGS